MFLSLVCERIARCLRDIFGYVSPLKNRHGACYLSDLSRASKSCDRVNYEYVSIRSLYYLISLSTFPSE